MLATIRLYINNSILFRVLTAFTNCTKCYAIKNTLRTSNDWVNEEDFIDR